MCPDTERTGTRGRLCYIDIDSIINLFKDPGCAPTPKGPIPEINEETCTEVTEKHSRCSYYKGSVTLTIPLPIVPDVNISLQMYQKGCYYSKLTNVPSDGCHDRENISEDKTVIKQNLEKASSTFKGYNLANLLEKCVCAQKHSVETYNKNDNKTTV
ncbi:uncharacterized protein LOC123527395 isoform X2 [Mercenaria mercenaria]|uniref:uncharacterized protein LOC123527395 isoform X2 n=1 Tax=Mercenaria mercenaria TaxID=6596 RepID=UPI00234E6AF2|nr:uncharacterized protein LOC123527395 isoform X2 [Mercenaria mercenaria]